MENVENLVICSTLNQITNYLIIKKFNQPKNIINITFNEDSKKKMDMNIDNSNWDEYLKDELKNSFDYKDRKDDISLIHKELSNKNIFDIELDVTSSYSVEEIVEKLEALVGVKQSIYWHITGGQRIISLAIFKFITDNKRKNDKLIYVEGNSEQYIKMTNEGLFDCNDDDDTSYGDKELDFSTALNLVGFKTNNNLKSTKKLKEKGIAIEDEKSIIERNFYLELYKELIDKSPKYSLDDDEEKHSFRELLLEANKFKSLAESKKYIKKLFNKVLEENKALCEINYNINESDELNKKCPAGYIFEKIAAYKIFEVIKNKESIVEMRTSLKTSFKKYDGMEDSNKTGIIDELDIALLTNTGKIMNFECKSGGMKGDNAKSHNYTTYRLSGVFGMPILLTPLYDEELKNNKYIKKDNDELKNQLQAFEAAKSAELKVFPIDTLESNLKKLLSNLK